MANYYFSAAGLTGNAGTINSPWPLSKVSTVGVGGDRLFFNGGDTLLGTIVYTRSGSAGNPIIFDRYGAAANNPIIDGQNTTSGPVLTISGSYITIKNLTIQNAQHINGLVNITAGIHDISISNCYFNTGRRGINAVNCGISGVANLSILNNWFTNIFDLLQTSGAQINNTFGAGSHIQLNNCNGSGMEIAYNNFYVPSPSTANNNNQGVGDVCSLYQCNGVSSSYILVHDNNFRGASNNQVTGYIWITLGDVGGSYQHVYNNIGVGGDAAGQGGFSIMPSGGTNLIEENNRSACVFSTNTHNAVGMGFAGVAASCTVQNNHLTWLAYGKGGNPYNKWFDPTHYSAPIGWSTNTADTASDPLATLTMLPNPLFDASTNPWNVVVVPVISYPAGTKYYFMGNAISSLSPTNTGAAATSYSVSPSLPAGLSLDTSTGIISGTPTGPVATTTYTVTASNIQGSNTTTVVIRVAAAYYFSNAGSTGNSGTSSSFPWPTSKWSTLAPTLGPDDKVMLKKGDNYASIQWTLANSGVAGHPIVFDIYGSAAANPILDGASSGNPVLTLNGSYVTINNIVIQNSAALNGNLYVTSGNRDITLYNCYTTGGLRGFHFKLCGAAGVANISIKNCFFYNIGVGGSLASGSGSSIQLNGCNGSGIEIANNKFQTDMSLSEASRDGVGDIISIYQCNGTAASYILVHDNQVRGGGSHTTGYAGLILGDVGGSYQKGYNNTFVKSGAEGAQIQAGTFITLDNNQMYSPQYDYCFEGIGFANYVAGAPCNNIKITNNKINWINRGGSHLAWFIDNSGTSNSTGTAGGAPLSADFTGTTSQYSFDATMTDALLPDPVFQPGDWNTGSAPVISYSPSTNYFALNVPIAPLTPVNTGGAPTSYSINTALPAGLNFDTTTGIISGTPTATGAFITYTITATNSSGSGTTTVSIQVINAPANLVIFGRKLIQL